MYVRSGITTNAFFIGGILATRALNASSVSNLSFLVFKNVAIWAREATSSIFSTGTVITSESNGALSNAHKSIFVDSNTLCGALAQPAKINPMQSNVAFSTIPVFFIIKFLSIKIVNSIESDPS